MRIQLLVACSLVSLLVACGGGDDAPTSTGNALTPDNTVPADAGAEAAVDDGPKTAVEALQRCKGTLICDWDPNTTGGNGHLTGDRARFPLVPRGEDCAFGTWGGFGSGFAPDNQVHWEPLSGSDALIRFRYGDELDCHLEGGVAASPIGVCEGSPYSCSRNSPPSCSDIRGCYVGNHVTWNNAPSPYCAGSPESCGNQTTQAQCRRQGCNWR